MGATTTKKCRPSRGAFTVSTTSAGVFWAVGIFILWPVESNVFTNLDLVARGNLFKRFYHLGLFVWYDYCQRCRSRKPRMHTVALTSSRRHGNTSIAKEKHNQKLIFINSKLKYIRNEACSLPLKMSIEITPLYVCHTLASYQCHFFDFHLTFVTVDSHWTCVTQSFSIESRTMLQNFVSFI